MSYQLSDLPYAYDALAPHIGPQTLKIHHGKHHRAYVDRLNELTEGNIDSDAKLQHLLGKADGALFDQAAQVWNHSFYWQSMSPDGGGNPDGELAKALASAFGSVERFRTEFAEAAKGTFGSGWAWLVQDRDGKLRVINTSNADTPIRHDLTPLLTIDVWEHAYYLDYQNDRGAYVETFLKHVLNWSFVASNFTTAFHDMMRRPGEIFEAPGDVLDHPALSKTQRIEVLQQWRYDAVQLQVAAQENMTGGEQGAGFIEKIDQALTQLDRN